MIVAKNIVKSYDNLAVLKGVNLGITKGEIVSIVGASGAGKTTLLQIIGTLDKADKGELIIKGTSVAKLNDKGLAKFRNENIGFVFQFHQLLPEFTALEKEGLKLLEFLGLPDRANHKPGELSGGEQQRVAVARALINRPAVVFADEPSGNLDSANAKELHELFFKLRDQFQQTFVIVTHNEELANMADRKLTISDGVIVS